MGDDPPLPRDDRRYWGFDLGGADMRFAYAHFIRENEMEIDSVRAPQVPVSESELQCAAHSLQFALYG